MSVAIVTPQSLGTWLRQPTTITGLATVAGGLVSGLLLFAAHSPDAAAALGGVAFAAVHLLMNDNTAADTAQTLVIAAVKSREAPK